MRKHFLLSLVIMAFAFIMGSASNTGIEGNSPASQKNKGNKMTKVKLETSMGDIVFVLFNETPQHRNNFIKLVKEGYYDGVLFHRVIKDFMIQTGDCNSKNAGPNTMLGEGDPGYTIEAEFVYPKYFHKRGAVAAARTPDFMNPERRSSGSQFYIVTGRYFSSDDLKRMSESNGITMTDEQIDAYTSVGGAPHLDGEYTVFGEVIEGMDVVDKIQNAETNRDLGDRPVTDIKIIKASIVK